MSIIVMNFTIRADVDKFDANQLNEDMEALSQYRGMARIMRMDSDKDGTEVTVELVCAVPKESFFSYVETCGSDGVFGDCNLLDGCDMTQIHMHPGTISDFNQLCNEDIARRKGVRVTKKKAAKKKTAKKKAKKKPGRKKG
jgi:hypothetical protein